MDMFNVDHLPDYLLEKRPKSTGKILIIRHANELDSKSPHGWSDLDLSKIGIRNAGKMATFLRGQNLHNLYSSDLRRALHTATIIGEQLNIRATPDFELRPWDIGVLADGDPNEVVPIIRYHIKIDRDSPVNGGESFNNFLSRFKKSLFKYILMAAKNNQNIGLVTHSKTLYAMKFILPQAKVTYKGKTPPSSILLMDVEDLSVSRIY